MAQHQHLNVACVFLCHTLSIPGTNDKRYHRAHWHLLCVNQLTILKPIPDREKGGTCSCLGKLQNRWRDISDMSLLKLVLNMSKSWCWVCQDLEWIQNISSNCKTGVRRNFVYKKQPLEVKWRVCDVPLYYVPWPPRNILKVFLGSIMS